MFHPSLLSLTTTTSEYNLHLIKSAEVSATIPAAAIQISHNESTWMLPSKRGGPDCLLERNNSLRSEDAKPAGVHASLSELTPTDAATEHRHVVKDTTGSSFQVEPHFSTGCIFRH